MINFFRHRKSAYFYSAFLIAGASTAAAALLWSSTGSGSTTGSRPGNAVTAETQEDASRASPEVADQADKSGSETLSEENLATALIMQDLPLMTTERLSDKESSNSNSYEAWQPLSMTVASSSADPDASGMTGYDLLSSPNYRSGTQAGFGATGFSLADAGNAAGSLGGANSGWAQSAGPGGMTGSMTNALTGAAAGPAADGAGETGAKPPVAADAAPGHGMEQIIAALSPDSAHFPTASNPVTETSDPVQDTTDPALAMPAGTDARPRSDDPSTLFKPDTGIIEPGNTDSIDLAKLETGDPAAAREEVTRPDNHPETSRSLLAAASEQKVDEPPASLVIGLGMLLLALRRKTGLVKHK
jgi:hypothetical protein